MPKKTEKKLVGPFRFPEVVYVTQDAAEDGTSLPYLMTDRSEVEAYGTAEDMGLADRRIGVYKLIWVAVSTEPVRAFVEVENDGN